MLSDRFNWLGNAEDLDAAVRAVQTALSLTADGDPDRHKYLGNLAERLCDRFDRLGDRADLEAAIEAAEAAVSLTPDGHLQKPLTLNTLSKMLSTRFHRLGDVADLQAAVTAAETAVRLNPEGHPEKPQRLNTLSNMLSDRFKMLGDRKDLEAAIVAARAVESLTPVDDPQKPGWLMNLANRLSSRFDRLGDPGDSQAAIEAAQTAVSLTPDGDPQKPGILNTLASNLSARFERLGGREDLSAAIEAVRAALSLTPEDHPGRPASLSNMAASLLSRFKLLGDREDLKAAIVAAQAAVNLTPDDHPVRPTYLNSLAVCLTYRFKLLGEGSDLDAAIGAMRAAVSLTPEVHPDRPGRLNNLANMLSDRSRLLGAREDLDAAIGVARQAVDLLHRLVTSEPDVSQLSADASHATRRLVGLLWQDKKYEAMAEAIENGRGVKLRADLVRSDTVPRGLDASQAVQYRDLVRLEREQQGKLEGLRTSLFDAEVLARQLKSAITPTEAEARALSQAHVQALAEQERKRAVLDDAMARLFELRALRKRLEECDPNFDPPAPKIAGLEALARDGHGAMVYLYPVDDELGTFWQVIHGGQGETPDDADQGMVKTLSFSRAQSLVFNNISGGQTSEPIGLLWAYLSWVSTASDLTAAADHKRLITEIWWRSLDHALEVLGRELLTPVWDRLRALGATQVVLIPGGQLGFLPLHATMLADGTRFGDHVEVRYAASAALLKRAHERLPRLHITKPHLVAIANPDRSLAFTDGQVRNIAKLFDPEAATVAYGTTARREWLLSRAHDADYLELSTHATFDLYNPARSAFQLAYSDGTYKQSGIEAATPKVAGSFEALTLGDIWQGQLALKPGCLVSANACETGQFDLNPKALEEQLGFPAAFLSAGASAVIASFWAVNDFSTWLLTEALYRRMIKGGENPAGALQQASKELRALTCEEVIKRVDRELPGVEAVRKAAEAENDTEAYHAATATLSAMRSQRAQLARQDPASRPFDHPYYWAAFGVHGAARPPAAKDQTRAAIAETNLVPKPLKQPWWKVWR